MEEKELIDMFIQERIEALYSKLRKEQPINEQENDEAFKAAERIIENLSEEDRTTVEKHLNMSMDAQAFKEVHLYKAGFLDGVKMMKEIWKL